MRKIVPNIWNTRRAAEAGDFYAAAFSGGTYEVESRYPETGLLDFQRDFAGAPLTVAVEIVDPEGYGTRLVLVNAGDEFSPNPSVSFMVNFDPVLFGTEQAAREELDATWAKLSDGGKVLMPLNTYPFSARYGWVEDRFGVSWQLILTNQRANRGHSSCRHSCLVGRPRTGQSRRSRSTPRCSKMPPSATWCPTEHPLGPQQQTP